jgi:plasmid stabilization system protein ParE
MIVRQLFFHPSAIDEGDAAARWYRERSARAAARFISEVFDVIDKVLATPQRWPAGAHGTRKAKLPCFPFIVIYREADHAIQILAIAHCRRRPGYWKRRK